MKEVKDLLLIITLTLWHDNFIIGILNHTFTYAGSTVLIFLSLSHLRRAAPVTHEISGYFTVHKSSLFSLKLISSQMEPKKKRQFTYSW